MIEENTEINFKEVLEVLINNIKVILLTTLGFSFISIFYSLSLPNIYTTSAIVVISENSSSGSSIPGIVSRFAGLADIAGINLPNYSKGKNSYAIEAELKSEAFFKRLITVENVLPSIMAAKSYDPISGEIIFDSEIYNASNGSWIKEPSFMNSYRKFNSSLNIVNEKMRSYISVSFDHISPKFSTFFLDLMVREYNNISRQEDIQESKAAIEYIKKYLAKESNIETRKSLSSIMQKQVEVQMLAEIKNFYILDYIDPPAEPDLKSSPKRSVIVISFSFFGFFLSILFFLSRYFLNRKI